MRVEDKVDEISASIADAFDVDNDETQKNLDNHDKRIVRLE